MKNFKVGFDYRGYHHPMGFGESTFYKDNYEFHAELSYVQIQHSASIGWVLWNDVTFNRWYISTTDLLDKVLKGKFKCVFRENNFTVYGKFTFKKQGKYTFLTNVE